MHALGSAQHTGIIINMNPFQKLHKRGITSNVLQILCSQFTSHIKKLLSLLVFKLEQLRASRVIKIINIKF